MNTSLKLISTKQTPKKIRFNIRRKQLPYLPYELWEIIWRFVDLLKRRDINLILLPNISRIHAMFNDNSCYSQTHSAYLGKKMWERNEELYIEQRDYDGLSKKMKQYEEHYLFGKELYLEDLLEDMEEGDDIDEYYDICFKQNRGAIGNACKVLDEIKK